MPDSPESKKLYGDLVVDRSRATVWRRNRLIKLSPKEYDLFLFLLDNQGCTLSRQALKEHLQVITNVESTSNLVDVYIGKIRYKTEVNGFPRVIHTVRSKGYCFQPTDE